jgi:hypothetical protein
VSQRKSLGMPYRRVWVLPCPKGGGDGGDRGDRGDVGDISPHGDVGDVGDVGENGEVLRLFSPRNASVLTHRRASTA